MPLFLLTHFHAKPFQNRIAAIFTINIILMFTLFTLLNFQNNKWDTKKIYIFSHPYY